MWCEGGEIGYVALNGGARVRYLRVGVGPPLVLMHTVRTQLDHFQLVIPQITDAFTVYALDFPGMGWSDIVAGASYEEPALRAAVVRVAEDLDLSDLTLAGESMGATLALTASVDLGDRVRRIVAVNTYDFADGVKRANLVASVHGDAVSVFRFPGPLGPLREQADPQGHPGGRRTARPAGAACPVSRSSSVASAAAPDTRVWPGRSTSTWRA